MTRQGATHDDEANYENIEAGDAIEVDYVSAYTDGDDTTTLSGVVDRVDAFDGVIDVYVVPNDDPDRRDHYADDSDATRRVSINTFGDGPATTTVEGRNGGRWNRLSEAGTDADIMVNGDDGTDDTDDDTVTAAVFHRKFTTDDGDRHEVGADLGMGIDFFRDTRDATVADVFPSAYDFAGTVDIDVTAGVDAPEAAAYGAWQDGRGHDAGSTRSMATGDIIAVGGDAHFVDRIGFETVDIDPDAHDGFGDDSHDDDTDDDESDHMDIETGDRVEVAYVSVYTDDDTTTTFTGTVDHIEAAIAGSRLCIVPDDAPDRDDYYAAGGDVTRRVEVVPVDGTDDLLCVEGKNGGRWNRLSEQWGCVSVTAVDADTGTDDDTPTAMTDGGVDRDD